MTKTYCGYGAQPNPGRHQQHGVDELHYPAADQVREGVTLRYVPDQSQED